MIGREEWAKFATENGIEWEEGPPTPRDQHGQEYCTLIAGDFEFAEQVKKVLGRDRYVIVRMFPHCADLQGKAGATRMRLSFYAEKPT